MSRRRKRPCEFGPYARLHCSNLDERWPEGREDKFLATWARVLLRLKRDRVDLRDGWLELDARGIRSTTNTTRVASGLAILEELARIVSLDVEVLSPRSCRLRSENFLAIQRENERVRTDPVVGAARRRGPSTGGRREVERESSGSRGHFDLVSKSPNPLQSLSVGPTFPADAQGEGKESLYRGGAGGTGSEARPGAAEVSGGPAAPASPPSAGSATGPAVVAARFAELVASEGTSRGARRARLGQATIARVAAAIPLSSIDGDAEAWRDVARNLVESAVARGVAPDHYLGGRPEDLASKLERLRNGPLWTSDGPSGDDPARPGPEARAETIEAERARIEAERARPIATPAEIRVISEKLARSLRWPDRTPTRRMS